MLLFETIMEFGVALAVSLVVTPMVIRYATSHRILDIPNQIKQHPVPVPAVGGIAIYISLGLTSLVAVLLNERIRISFAVHSRFWWAIAISATLIFFIGLYDDLMHAPIWARFGVQTMAALVTIFLGGIVMGTVGIPSGGLHGVGLFAVPLTVLWIVGVTNAFNLIDGMDGLAGGIGFISTATVFAITVMTTGNYMVMLVSAALCGAIAGFLRYNRAPARIFMGDCGSMLLGYSLSVLAILGRTKKETALAILIPILIVGVPVFDTLASMIRRLSRRLVVEGRFRPAYLLSMFTGDRGHIHHLLLGMGHDQRLSVVILYALSLILAFFALLATIINKEALGFILVLFGIGAFLMVRQGWHRLFGKNGRGSGTGL